MNAKGSLLMRMNFYECESFAFNFSTQMTQMKRRFSQIK